MLLAWNPLAIALNLAGLGLLVWGLDNTGHLGTSGRHLVALVLVVVAVASWLVELFCRYRSQEWLVVAAMVAMGAAGGIVASLAPLGIVFVGIVGLVAAMRLDVQRAVALASVGPLALVIAGAVDHSSSDAVIGGVAATLGGLIMGTSRRRTLELAEQAALVAVARDRIEIERARAELLAERNRLAREIHDVLAHTLSALAVRVESLAAVVESGTASDAEMTSELSELRRLVHGGLREAREAVGALRDDAGPIADQLARLCAERHVSFEVSGESRRLPAEVSLSLYRIAQEGLTNAFKHAAGQPVAVTLDVGGIERDPLGRERSGNGVSGAG